MAYITMAYITMAYIVMAYMVMAYIAMAYTVMAYLVEDTQKKYQPPVDPILSNVREWEWGMVTDWPM